MIEGISAITLATHDMARAVGFYRAAGFDLLYGGADAAFTSFGAGRGYLNLVAEPAARQWSWWGRAIFMPGWSPRASAPTRRHATPNGASAISTSPIPTATS